MKKLYLLAPLTRLQINLQANSESPLKRTKKEVSSVTV